MTTNIEKRMKYDIKHNKKYLQKKMDFFTNFVIYFGSGVIVGMIIGVYCIIDDERIRQVYLRFSEEDS